MKLDISKLSEDREFELSEEWDAGAFDLDVPGWHYIEPVKIQARAHRNSGMAMVKLLIQAPLSLTCSRCSKTFVRPFEKAFQLGYSIDLSEKVIFLDDNIREELILSYPHKFLCSQECRGLCLRCGTDLNEEKCRCKRY